MPLVRFLSGYPLSIIIMLAIGNRILEGGEQSAHILYAQCSQRGSPSVLGVDGGGRRSVVPSGLFPNLPCDPRPRTVARPSRREMFHAWKSFMFGNVSWLTVSGYTLNIFQPCLRSWNMETISCDIELSMLDRHVLRHKTHSLIRLTSNTERRWI